MVRPESDHGGRAADLRAQIKVLDKKISSLVATAEAADEVAELSAMISTRSRERKALKNELAAMLREGPSDQDIASMASALGGLATVLTQATADEKGRLYRSLNILLTYHPQQRCVDASLALRTAQGQSSDQRSGRDNACPEGDLNPHPR